MRYNHANLKTIRHFLYMTSLLRIATRQSPLALWQAHFVKTELERHWPELSIQLIPMKTSGDRFLKDTLAAIGGKGMFVKELELAILENRADLAVHSLKDVPAHLPEGLILSTFLQREDPRDALVSPHASLATLPPGSVVGTASLRRQALIKYYYPHLKVEVLRGNVNSRLAKLDEGAFDAIILAVAGLKRLNMVTRIAQTLPLDQFIPAVGQGVLTLETRTADLATQRLLKPLHHIDTALRVRAERAFNERLGGACHVPVAGHATLSEQGLQLSGLVASVDGLVCLQATASSALDEPEALGVSLANELLSQGAAAILQAS